MIMKRLSVIFMEEKTIQSIPVMPFAMMMGLISAAIGFIVGIFYALVFGAILAANIPSSAPINLGWLSVIFGVGAIIIMPIIFFVAGLIQGVIVAVLYNFLAPRIGGIKLHFKTEG